MKKLLFFIAVLILSYGLKSQNIPNPYASIGKPMPKMATVTNGQYQEFFIEDSLVQIGTTVMNRKTGKVAYFQEDRPSAYTQLTETKEKSFRWLSVDPLESKYPMLTPYQFAGNTPIQALDPDGRYIYLVTQKYDEDKQAYVPTITKITAKNLKSIPGYNDAMKTKSGSALLNKYQNSSTKDVYITVATTVRLGEKALGITLNPKANGLDEKGTFDSDKLPLNRVDKLNFENFNGVKVREGAQKNFFVVLDKNIPTEDGKSETVFHELLHVDYFDKGIPSSQHHEKMGDDNDHQENDKNKPIQKFREELKEQKEGEKK